MGSKKAFAGASTTGLITALIGVFGSFSGQVGSTDVRIGDGMVLLSSFGLATINILLRRFMVPQSDKPTQPMNQFQTLFGQMVFGVPVYYILSWVFEGGTAAYKFSSLSACLSLIYQGTVVAGFCFIAWVSSLVQDPRLLWCNQGGRAVLPRWPQQGGSRPARSRSS